VTRGRGDRAGGRLEGLEGFVEGCMEDWGIPGCVVGIVEGGRLVYARGFGLRDVKRRLPVTEQTGFPIKSGTKAFTAVATAMLVGEGKLDWDTPIREYMPSFRMCDPAATKHTSIRDLLAHRSGLAGHYAALYTSLATSAGIIERLPYLEPRGELRSGYHYANLGYAVAGAVLEHVAGMTWQELIRTRIFRPLDMRTSGFGTDEAASLGELAVGHRKGRRGPVAWFRGKEFDLAMACESKAPAMGIVSNVGEMGRWLRLQMNRGKVGRRRIVEARLLRETHTAQIRMGGKVRNRHLSDASYAMGWHVQSYRRYRWIHHSGSGHGYSAHVSFMPGQSIGVVMLTNGWRTPLRWIIPFNVYDRLLGLDRIPWNDTYLRIAKRQQDRQARQGASGEPSSETFPVSALGDYVGDYHHAGYGRLSVCVERGRLRIHYNGITFRTRYCGRKVFEATGEHEDPAVEDPIEVRASFRASKSGSVTSVAIPLEPAVKDIVFRKMRDSGARSG
jgi:CubicO group peptidase (beta-lactamase class C family)